MGPCGDAHRPLTRHVPEMNDVSRAEAYKDMRALNEPADPDSRLHAAWLGQASATSEESVAKQASEHGVLTRKGGRAGTRSRLGTATRLEEQDVASLQRSRVGKRSRITTAVIGFGFAVALAAPGVLLHHLRLSESSRLGDRGLIPKMELSAGRAAATDAWELPAADLQYAWIAPPRDFVGSADLVAELHPSNSEVVDHKSKLPEGEREQMLDRPSTDTAGKQENEGKSAGAHDTTNSRRAAKKASRPRRFDSLTVGDGTHSPKGLWDWSR